MKQELLKMKNKLQLERQELINKLQKMDDDLASIDRVLDLMEAQRVIANKKQLPLIKRDLEPAAPKSSRFKKLTFRKAITILFEENPGKHWKPGEIADVLLENGFSTKSKKFKNTVRTLLSNFRKSGDIVATGTKSGWIYSSMKNKDSAPQIDEAESNENTGGLGERSKPANL